MGSPISSGGVGRRVAATFARRPIAQDRPQERIALHELPRSRRGPGHDHGAGAVVGGVVVYPDVESYTVVAGVPARKLRN